MIVEQSNQVHVLQRFSKNTFMNIEKLSFGVKSQFHYKMLSTTAVLLGNVHIFIVISQYNSIQYSIQFITKYWFSTPQYFCDTDPSLLEMEWYLVSSYQLIYQVPCHDIHLSATCIAAVLTFSSQVTMSLGPKHVRYGHSEIKRCSYLC